MKYKVAFFVALMTTALAMGAALAHLLEIFAKMDMARDQYFIVQSIYAGWNRIAYILVVQLASLIAVLVMSRSRSQAFWFTAMALAALVGSQIIFWTFTYPANAATSNWTAIPQDWAALRHQWEYSHAAGALLQIVAMGSLCWAALSRDR